MPINLPRQITNAALIYNSVLNAKGFAGQHGPDIFPPGTTYLSENFYPSRLSGLFYYVKVGPHFL